MKRATASKLLAYLSIALIIGCGAALLGPIWYIPYAKDLTGSRIYPSTDENAFYVVSGLTRYHPLVIEKFDFEGNSLNLQTFSELTQPKYIRKQSTDSVYIGFGGDPIETMTHLNLETGEQRPAFAEPDFSQYLSRTLVPQEVDHLDNLYITGPVQLSESRQLYMIGKLEANGRFIKFETPDHYTRSYVYPMHDGTNLAVLAETTSDYLGDTGIKSVLMFFDSNLGLLSQFEFEDEFSASYAMNDGLFGHFNTGEHAGGIRKIDVSGDISDAPEQFSELDYAFGADHFFMLKYENDLLNGHRKACRFNYDLQLLNCFTMSIEGDYDRLEVTADGSLAMTEFNYAPTAHFESAGVTIENVESAIKGKLEVRGYLSNTLTQRSFSPAGKLLLKSKPPQHKRKGRFEICHDSLSGISWVCLKEEAVEPGVCALNKYSFLNQKTLVTTTNYCEGYYIETRLNFWQADN